MSEFATEVTERIEQTRQSLAEAEADGDDYLVGVRVGELESLTRLAADHDVEVPGAAEDLARHTDRQEIVLPDSGSAADVRP
ncbi:MAG: hypothetical protein ACLGIV_13550 [Actinomycetes bacterium]